MLIEPMLKANKVVVNKFSEVAIKLQKRAGLSDHQQLTPAQTTSHSCWPWMTTSPHRLRYNMYHYICVTDFPNCSLSFLHHWFQSCFYI